MCVCLGWEGGWEGELKKKITEKKAHYIILSYIFMPMPDNDFRKKPKHVARIGQ